MWAQLYRSWFLELNIPGSVMLDKFTIQRLSFPVFNGVMVRRAQGLMFLMCLVSIELGPVSDAQYLRIAVIPSA